MDENEESLNVTLNFLNNCKKAIPKISQLNYNIYNSMEKVAHSKGEKVDGDSETDKCNRCFVDINYSRTLINLSDRKSNKKLSINCHFCKTLLRESTIDFEPVKEPTTLKPVNNEAEVLSKKKRKRSDKSAGLILPNAPKSKLSANNLRLKSLLDANSSEVKQGKLQEFLSKM